MTATAGELIVNGGFGMDGWSEGQAPFGWVAPAYNHRLLGSEEPWLRQQLIYPSSTVPTVWQAFRLPDGAQGFTVTARCRVPEPGARAYVRVREHRDGAAGSLKFFDGSAWRPTTADIRRTDQPEPFEHRYFQGDASGITVDHSASADSPQWTDITFQVPRLEGVTVYRLELGLSGANGDAVYAPCVEWQSVSAVTAPDLPAGGGDFVFKGPGVDADRILAEPPRYRARVAQVNGMPALEVDGEAVTALGWDTIINHTAGDQELYDMLYTSKFTLARLVFALGESTYHQVPYPPTWLGPDSYDWTYLDQQLMRIRNANPEIRIMLKLAMDGTQWWCDLHPESTTTLNPPYNDTLRVPDFLSPQWRRDSRELLRQLIAHLQQGPFAEMVIGYCLFNGMSLDCNWEPDMTSVHGLAAFRAFLRDRYGDDAALRQAWSDPSVTLATAVPDVEFTAAMSPYPMVFAPADHRRIADSLDFRAWCDARFIGDFAADVKEATHRRAVVGARSGNLIYGAWNWTPHGYGHANALGGDRFEFLWNPDFDFIDQWTSYPGRWLGDYGSWAPVMPNVGLARHNKLYLLQNDVRTHVNDDPVYAQVSTLEESLSQQKSVFAASLTLGLSPYLWQMSYKFNAPGLMELWQQQSDIFARSLELPRQSDAEIAFVVDADMNRYLGRDFEVTDSTRGFFLMDYPRFNWARAGAAYDLIFLDQVPGSAYKVYVFYLTLRLTEEEMAAIRETLAANGATAIFAWNSGIIDAEDRFSLANMEMVTGMELAISPAALNWRMNPTAEFLARGYDPAYPLGILDRPDGGALDAVFDHVYPPSVVVADPEATVLGTSAASGAATLAEKDFGDYRILYSMSNMLAPGVLRYALRRAGGFEYLDSDDILYLNASFAGVHTRSSSDSVTLHFPEPTALYEVFSGVELAAAADFTIPVEPCRTYLWFRGSRAEWEGAADR